MHYAILKGCLHEKEVKSFEVHGLEAIEPLLCAPKQTNKQLLSFTPYKVMIGNWAHCGVVWTYPPREDLPSKLCVPCP